MEQIVAPLRKIKLGEAAENCREEKKKNKMEYPALQQDFPSVSPQSQSAVSREEQEDERMVEESAAICQSAGETHLAA